MYLVPWNCPKFQLSSCVHSVAERTKAHVIWSSYTIELSYELTNAIQETSTFKSNANRLISTVARAGMLLLPKYSR